ncbi:MAG: hypothetical protein WDN67_00690 [Candidatus Moraniibacteriota bacterium]
MKQATEAEVLKGLKRVKKSVEDFHRMFNDRMPQDMGFHFLLAVVKNKSIVIEKIQFDANEISLNVESLEKAVVYKLLAKKYKELDRKEISEHKKRTKKEVKEFLKKKQTEEKESKKHVRSRKK